MKIIRVKYLYTVELRKSISSMGDKKVLLKIIISIGEKGLNKKTTPSINIPFSSKVGTIKFHFKNDQRNCNTYIRFLPQKLITNDNTH